MAGITATVTGTEQVAAKLKRLDAPLALKLADGMRETLIRMQSTVRTGKLSGQVLHQRTGNLSRSISYDVQTSARQFIEGQLYVGKEAPYGAVHEYGGTFTQHIPSHERLIKMAFGQPIEPRVITVREFTRTVTYPVRSFMRTTLAEYRQIFIDMVNRCVREALA